MRSVKDVEPAPKLALVAVSAKALEQVAQECIDAGVKRVWFVRNLGGREAQQWVVRLCRDAGLEVVDGKCPYMFMPQAGFPHNIHRTLTKPFGSYDKSLEQVPA